ncbi:DNA cytosine methyltransferase [Stutzerimonas nitrititolerans]|uniref:DNA cytosine methyltransferase n=1 Tax=Stutzerimonas nitrititolerans TaxID=2482751 RepID=UPI0028A8BAF5|nr:DNA cytosine methyltransferase [Stutzerimonas nitrititolerans]
MPAYYNEIDPYAAQWLRNLIAAGHIAPGDVDERSIEDVRPADLAGYTQCHFFAGVGVWSLALRRAGWPDDLPVWTGSCPCQPFSAAGKGAGFADERHLWPSFHWLIQECRPAIVAGEQVASKDADAWVDLVQADLEALGYAFGAVPFPSAGVGAPHIRDRLYWMANADGARSFPSPLTGVHSRESGAGSRYGQFERPSSVGGMVDPARSGRREECADAGRISSRNRAERIAAGLEHGGLLGGVADTHGRDASTEREQRSGQQRQQPEDSGLLQDGSAGPVNGLWRDADWLFCRDGKWRPVEPGTFPLAHGATSRVGRLRAYGNAINAEAARIFIQAAMNA